MTDRISTDELRFFDRNDDFGVSFGRLPHWTQAGTVVFITWRTADSMPRDVIRQWVSARNKQLQECGLDPFSDWRSGLKSFPEARALAVKWQLIERFDEQLDGCCGACVLRDPRVAQCVAESLFKFDGERYLLTDFVVMPNHVHVLGAFPSEESLRQQVSGWKRFQARRINSLLGTSGPFWQVEDFDHLVRSEEQFEHYRRYIASNPTRAGLKEGQFLHWTRQP
jgi:putative transposase